MINGRKNHLSQKTYYMKTATIIYKNNANAYISKSNNDNKIYYCIYDDHAHFIELRNKYKDCQIKNLAGLFDETYTEIKNSLLILLSDLNKKNDSLEWWGGPIASRSTAQTPLILNIVYLFCAKRILSESEKDIVFILTSHALLYCITEIAKKQGYRVIANKKILVRYIEKVQLQCKTIIIILYFIWNSYLNKIAGAKLVKPFDNKISTGKKRVMIRSWVTQGSINSTGELADRNFGILPKWLRSKNYEVVTLPIFFNLDRPGYKLYSKMKNNGDILIQEQFLKLNDYFKVIRDAYKLRGVHIQKAAVGDVDIAPIINEIIKQRGIIDYPFSYNLCYPLLKRLKREGVEIDSFLYPFENNSPEKQFVLGCRKYFPTSDIVGYQHTTFISNQLTYHIGTGEEQFYPFPNRIICSGTIYIKLFKDAGFPIEILKQGPNLRYGAVYLDHSNEICKKSKKKILLLPLTFSDNLAYDLLYKVKEALEGTRGYVVFIRNHPLILKEKIIRYLDDIGMHDIEFADSGIIQDWLIKSFAVISTGSVTILETIVMGVPVIRVIPDNTFFYDTYYGSGYPLEPVNTASEIKQQLHKIEMIKNRDEIFRIIAKKTLSDYFTKPNEKNMNIFL